MYTITNALEELIAEYHCFDADAFGSPPLKTPIDFFTQEEMDVLVFDQRTGERVGRLMFDANPVNPTTQGDHLADFGGMRDFTEFMWGLTDKLDDIELEPETYERPQCQQCYGLDIVVQNIYSSTFDETTCEMVDDNGEESHWCCDCGAHVEVLLIDWKPGTKELPACSASSPKVASAL